MTQNQWILGRLKAGYEITPMDALKGCGCFRLAARINDLRTEGHQIKTGTIILGGKCFASYKLVKK